MLEHEWHTGDREYLGELMRSGRWTLERERFLSLALLPYYESGVNYWDGLERDAGNIIYRLSDFIDAKERKTFAVYPSKDGSITLHEGEEGEYRWDSLEDWRVEWAANHPNIPDQGVAQDFIREFLQTPQS